MDIVQRFFEYAGDFEKTLADDNWPRLGRYFTDDAVYEVKAESFGCRLTGSAAILAGMKKSLDGFDRKFDGRDLELTSGPEVKGDEIRMAWKVIYRKEGATPYVLEGRSSVRYRDGKIAYLQDSYDPSVDEVLATWQRENASLALDLDPSYV